MPLLLLLLACQEEKIDTGTAPLPPWEVDADGDGVTADLDCDDADAAVFPGNDEVCDGVDQDCDDQIDEEATDASSWYPDDDDDGYGDMYAGALSCNDLPGYTQVGTDCDDSDEDVHPLADERCNGEDDNCDGVEDEGLPEDSPTWYADADGDGYGDPAVTDVFCVEQAGWVADATDCDDTNAARHPGVDEHCDAVDEDCDGEIDDDPVDGSTWYTDADGDTFGDPDAPVNACHRENTTTSNADDCNDGNLHVYPGAEEHCDDEDEDCDGTVDDEAEEAAAFHADADGDGHGDPDVTSVSCNAPAGYVYDDSDCDDADPTIQDDRDGDGIADCPDLDGDGLANDAEVDGVVTGFVTDPGDPDTDGDGTDDGSDPAPLHASCATAILAWEDFDADPVDWTVISGTWTWDGSAWDTTADPAAAWLGEETWTDLTFEAAVRVDAGGEAGVIVRTSDGIDGWYVSLDEADDLVRVVNTTELGSASATVDPSTWYTLRVEVLGADADIYLDDAWLLTVTDTATTGSLGVWSTGAASSFDELFACE